MIRYIFSILIFLGASSGVQAQNEIVYQHPDLDIHFTASPNWNQVSYSAQTMTYELANKNNNMHMKVWYERTEESVTEYLRKEVCLDGMVDEKTFTTSLDEKDAYGIYAICSEMRRPYKVMLLAIPTDDGFYCFRFRCPEECYQEHQQQIQRLLETISLSPVVERKVFYASNN